MWPRAKAGMEKRQSSSSSRSLHSRVPCLYFLECVGDPVSFGILLMLEMCLNPSGGTGDWGSGRPYSKTGYARANTAGFLLDGSSLVGDRRRGKWARKRSTYGGLTLVGPPSVLNGQSPSRCLAHSQPSPSQGHQHVPDTEIEVAAGSVGFSVYREPSYKAPLRCCRTLCLETKGRSFPDHPTTTGSTPWASRSETNHNHSVLCTSLLQAVHYFMQRLSDSQWTRWCPNLPTSQGVCGFTR